MTPGEKITALRTAKQLTQAELAEGLTRSAKGAFVVSRDQVANWETDRHHPEWQVAKALVRYLKITLDQLFFEDQKIDVPSPIKRKKRTVA